MKDPWWIKEITKPSDEWRTFICRRWVPLWVRRLFPGRPA
jgi:hypothetical protein